MDLKHFRKSEQQQIFDEVDRQLVYEPTVETKNRKPLRPNQLAAWELRIGKYRVFYNIFNEVDLEVVKIVKIEAVGFKQHSKLFIRGREFEL